MTYQVLLTADAEADLEAIYDYISEHDVPGKADYVLGQIEEIFGSLSASPHRGNYPNELLSLGIREFREIFFKPYHIIYQVSGKRVYVYLIADGRRDMGALLQRRLL